MKKMLSVVLILLLDLLPVMSCAQTTEEMDAAYHAAVALLDAGKPGSAYPEFLKLAEQGYVDAYYAIGYGLNTGDFNGGIPDYARARDWYVKAYEAGADGALDAAIRLCADGFAGEGDEMLLEKDREKLYGVLTSACERGAQDTIVYDWLGWLCSGNGGIIEADYVRALEIYTIGANLGSGYSMAQIGAIYRDAHPGAADLTAATSWFTKALEAGYEPAQEMLDNLSAE